MAQTLRLACRREETQFIRRNATAYLPDWPSAQAYEHFNGLQAEALP
jgi:hypothetical protein